MDSENANTVDDLVEDASDTADLHVSAGERLRLAREEKGLTLDNVAAETRIPVRHLETIEAGHYEELPARTYAIGFSRTYARAVGLDERVIADQVRDEIGAKGPRYSSVGQGMEPGDPAKLPSAGLAWFRGFAALVLIIGIIAFASTYFGAGDGPQSLLVQQEAEEKAATAQAQAAAAAPPVAAAAVPSADGEVVLTAREDVWVKVYERGGDSLFQGTLASGDTYKVPSIATDPLINTGRPDMLTITIDGQEVAMLADKPVSLGDAPISAAALLARAPASPTQSSGQSPDTLPSAQPASTSGL